MTTKANEIVVDALEDLVIQADEAPIEASEARAALRILNDMMAMWEANGIDLDYTPVSNLGDEITVDAGAIFGIKAHLAIALADKYDVVVPPSVFKKAREGWKAIQNIAITLTASSFPPTLPQGSGNTYPGFASDTFFPEAEEDS